MRSSDFRDPATKEVHRQMSDVPQIACYLCRLGLLIVRDPVAPAIKFIYGTVHRAIYSHRCGDGLDLDLVLFNSRIR